jgi:hypothetical protein|uniref:Uncharacterized protein n=1 Tax=viral metagenome TaxID=1070528 RepID=A0A6C0CW72_9ZZZZ
MDSLKEVLLEMEQSPLKGTKKEEYFVTKYKTIADEYPMIIKKACDDDFDYAKMFWMIDKKLEVDSQRISQHDASIEVGEVLVDQYIKPIVD